MSSHSPVRVWEERVLIPTYPVPPPDPNPMFLEKRVYQGSSGKVYPNPFTDRVSDEKKEIPYQAVFLENEYIRVMVLPEIGGRVQAGLDKTNGYDFIYRQHVIKPALAGLLGPWISGGIEFNWPQHHRPSTFMPVDYVIEDNPDGSGTVWLSEHEPMNRMKGMIGITVYPGKALIEGRVRLYNRTPFVQSFLWWANLGVHVHEQYQAFFPPDVTCIADHARRAISEFPIARGFYYGVDYTRGVDIRWYKNIPVPTSYMVTESRFDFLGGYDHARQAGVVHVADHHIAPGKKLWTWGNAEFGHAWDRELTDSDGPYVELMAGVYTDNQPDFSWLQPYETKTFCQYWYPIQHIGLVKNANRQLAVSLESAQGSVKVGVCSTELFSGAQVTLSARGKALLDRTTELEPGRPFVECAKLAPTIQEKDLLLMVRDRSGCELIRYCSEAFERKPLPNPATEPPAPERVETVEELYLSGLHLDQYRHPTRNPEVYWQEAVRRDPQHSRSHNALGLRRLRRGEFPQAEKHFRRAIERLTCRNLNPYDTEPYYSLALALKFQNRFDRAYDSFYKAAWNQAWQPAGYYALAEIECCRRDFQRALEHLDRSLVADGENLKARNLKAAVLRRLGRCAEAEMLARETIAMDPLDFWCRNELLLAGRQQRHFEESEKTALDVVQLMRGQAQTYLDIAFDYAGAGLWEEAVGLLERLAPTDPASPVYPIVLYALGYFAHKTGDVQRAQELYRHACQAPPDYCFPARLEELLVLEDAVSLDPENGKAFYYLGNLLYDKRRYEEAIEAWERSCKLDSEFSIPWRNLGIAYYNIRHDPEKAQAAYRRAFEINPRDARVLYEFDQLQKRTAESPKNRLVFLDQHLELINQRDDLSLERVTLLNQTGQPQKALEILCTRRFHPWEGGEGLVSSQYVWAHLLLGEELLDSRRSADALIHFKAAREYPENLGEAKHLLVPENHLYYFEGLAQRELGNPDAAKAAFRRAAESCATISAMTYYQGMALTELGENAASADKFRELGECATGQLRVQPQVDYFATSLPNFLLFEDNLEKRHRVEQFFLLGLAYLGQGKRDEAQKAFQEALSLDLNHLAAQQQLRKLFRDPCLQS